jgi:valyl-tRNA synthetase
LLVLPKTPLSAETLAILGSLTRASEVTVIAEAPAGTPSLVTDLGTLFLPLEGLVDLDAERKRIDAEITKVEAEIAKVQAKLSDPNFTEKVPPAILEDHRDRQSKWTEKLTSLKATLQTLG